MTSAGIPWAVGLDTPTAHGIQFCHQARNDRKGEPQMTIDYNYPAYVERDTYEGPWSISRRNARSSVFTAAELAGDSAPGSFIVLWESFGHINGVQHFGRTRFRVQTDGSLVGYTGSGTPIIHHPADRKIRVLVK